jgi:hypothetical protein
MVLFIDTLMLAIDQKIATYNKTKRQDIILKFLESAGVVKLINYKRRRKIQKSHTENYETIKIRSWREKYYLSMALRCCLSVRGVYSDDKWHYFTILLATVFSYEHTRFSKWLVEEIDTVDVGFKYLPLRGLSGKSKTVAIEFALKILMPRYVEKCACHYKSQIKRDKKWKRWLAKQEVDVQAVLGFTQPSTKVVTNSTETDPSAEHPSADDASKCDLDLKHESGFTDFNVFPGFADFNLSPRDFAFK